MNCCQTQFTLNNTMDAFGETSRAQKRTFVSGMLYASGMKYRVLDVTLCAEVYNSLTLSRNTIGDIRRSSCALQMRLPTAFGPRYQRPQAQYKSKPEKRWRHFSCSYIKRRQCIVLKASDILSEHRRLQTQLLLEMKTTASGCFLRLQPKLICFGGFAACLITKTLTRITKSLCAYGIGTSRF